MKRKKKKYIRIRTEDAKIACRDLNVLVVSFDRLGSAFYDDLQGLAIEKDRFLREVHAFRMLARMRSVLCKAYESGMTKVEIQHWYDWLEKAKKWEPKV